MDAHQTSIYAAILISSFIIGTIILYFVVSIIHQQRRSNHLYKISIEAEISTLEKERRRMAADLHDELGPLLSAIKYRVGSMDIVSEDDQENAAKINDHIDTVVYRMREISNDLMPNVLLHKGVVIALHDFIDNMRKPEGLQIHFATGPLPMLSEFQSIHIYRIVLEIIHNTIKHASASDLKIELSMIKNSLVLQTKDNGQGFDYYLASMESNRLGLRNLVARSEMLSGSLLAETARGKGTRYTIEIPLTSPLTETK